MPEPTTLQRERLAEIRQKVNEQFAMRPMGSHTEASVRAEATRLVHETFGEQAIIDMAHLYRCPQRDCEFESMDPDAICPLHDRRVYAIPSCRRDACAAGRPTASRCLAR